jgi:hypothetical protein
VKFLFYKVFPDFGKSIAFGWLTGFARLSFWKEQQVDEDQYAALVE